MRIALLMFLLTSPVLAQIPWREPHHDPMPNFIGQPLANAHAPNAKILYAKGHPVDVVFRQYPLPGQPMDKEVFLYVGAPGETIAPVAAAPKSVPSRTYAWGPQAFAVSQLVFGLAIFLSWRRRR